MYSKLNLRRYLGIFVATIVLTAAWARESSRTEKSDEIIRGIKDMPPFTMTESAQSMGLIHQHNPPHVIQRFSHVEAFVAADSATVAVADVNNDGWQDIFANDSSPGGKSALFINQGDGTFKDLAKQAGVEVLHLTYSNFGVFFFDYDNDGNKDLLVLTSRVGPRIFRNEGKLRFKEVTNDLGLAVTNDHFIKAPLSAMVSAVLDFDNDGFLDLIVADKWGPAMPDSLVDASNGGKVMVFRNVGAKKFERVPGDLGFNHQGFTRSIGIYDIRGTGKLDVWFANDFAADKLYLGEGNGKFRNASDRILLNNFSRNGMNTDMADLENDGKTFIFVSHIYERGYRPAGNQLWRWSHGDEFRENGRSRGVYRCGWAWGGKFIDLDNNGYLDLVVGNGYISRNPQKSYWYFMSVLSGSDRHVAGNARNWPPLKDASLAGYQKACVYYNDGTGRFVDIANSTGMAGDLSDERGLATIDFLNNGSQSLAIANQNQMMTFYRVDQNNRHAWMGFKLIGTKSNRDSYGAKVILRLTNGVAMSRQVQTMNGYASQSDERIHFGLGDAPTLASVEITWPSGAKKRFGGGELALNVYHTVEEPK